MRLRKAIIGIIAVMMTICTTTYINQSQDVYAADNNTFIAKINNEGKKINCNFKVITESSATMNGTVQVGDGIFGSSTIDQSTTGKIEIPETVINGDKTYTVIAIGDSAFMFCEGLTSTGLENNTTVRSIGTFAFASCTSLVSTGLENNTTVELIANEAFSGCNNLKEIVFQQYTLPTINGVFDATGVNIYYLLELTNPEELDDCQAASVTKLDVKNINVKTAPTKTIYQVGETFDPTGLVLDVDYDKIVKERAYSDSQIKDLFSFSKTTPLTTSDTSITITYNGKTTTQSITVKKAIKDISINTKSTKLSYIKGENFNPKGLVLTVSYDDNSQETITYNDTTKSDFTFDKEVLGLNDRQVVITYKGKTVTQDIEVSNKTIDSIKIEKKSTKQSYIEGENFDPKGLVLIVNYNNGSQETVTYNDTTKADFTFDKEVLGLNDRQVVITYKEKTVTQDITVEKKAIEPETGDNTYIGISIMMLVISMFVINAKRKKEIK